MRDEYDISKSNPRKNPYVKTTNVDVKKVPTETQMEMLKQAVKRPISFDEGEYEKNSVNKILL